MVLLVLFRLLLLRVRSGGGGSAAVVGVRSGEQKDGDVANGEVGVHDSDELPSSSAAGSASGGTSSGRSGVAAGCANCACTGANVARCSVLRTRGVEWYAVAMSLAPYPRVLPGGVAAC